MTWCSPKDNIILNIDGTKQSCAITFYIDGTDEVQTYLSLYGDKGMQRGVESAMTSVFINLRGPVHFTFDYKSNNDNATMATGKPSCISNRYPNVQEGATNV